MTAFPAEPPQADPPQADLPLGPLRAAASRRAGAAPRLPAPLPPSSRSLRERWHAAVGSPAAPAPEAPAPTAEVEVEAPAPPEPAAPPARPAPPAPVGDLVFDADWSHSDEFDADFADAAPTAGSEPAGAPEPVQATPAAAWPGPSRGDRAETPFGLELVSGPDLYSPLAAAQQAAAESGAGGLEESRTGSPTSATEDPLFEHVADRLERIARSLRDRTPAEILSVQGGADPLQVLITGYALGYSEALRRVRERERDGPG